MTRVAQSRAGRRCSTKHARIIERRTPVPRGEGVILVAAAGTSDIPVAEEAAISAEVMGNDVDRLYDVGVAGLHRLLAEHDRLTAARVIIVVAGMEGALPSVDRRPGAVARSSRCRRASATARASAA